MAKPSRSGKLWTKEGVRAFKDLAQHNTPTRVIAVKIHRAQMQFNQRLATKTSPLLPGIRNRTTVIKSGIISTVFVSAVC